MAQAPTRTVEPALGAHPGQARSVQTRTRVFESAMRAYARHGVDGARTEDIVADAGVGWGTFFNYFPRKEDVLLAAAVQLQDAMETAMTDARRRRKGVGEAVSAAYDALARAPYPPPLLAAVIREVMARGQRFEALLKREGRRTMWVALAELLEQGQRDGVVRTDVEASALARLVNLSMLAAFTRIGVPGDVGLPGDSDLRELASTSLRVLWDGLARKA